MTLQEKIDRLTEEAAGQGAWRSTVTPMLARVYWRMGLDVPPPVMWPFWVNVIFNGLVFAGVIFVLDRLLVGTGRHMVGRDFAYAGTAFGIFVAYVIRWRARHLKLSRWYERSAGKA